MSYYDALVHMGYWHLTLDLNPKDGLSVADVDLAERIILKRLRTTGTNNSNAIELQTYPRTVEQIKDTATKLRSYIENGTYELCLIDSYIIVRLPPQSERTTPRTIEEATKQHLALQTQVKRSLPQYLRPLIDKVHEQEGLINWHMRRCNQRDHELAKLRSKVDELQEELKRARIRSDHCIAETSAANLETTRRLLLPHNDGESTRSSKRPRRHEEYDGRSSDNGAAHNTSRSKRPRWVETSEQEDSDADTEADTIIQVEDSEMDDEVDP